MPPHASNSTPQSPDHPALAGLRLAGQWMAGGRKLQRTLATVLGPIGLGESELLVLLAIDNGGSAPGAPTISAPDQKQLAGELGISPALMSQLVEQMRRQSWIASERHPRDRRRQVWQITPTGRELLGQALDLLLPWAMDVQQAALTERTAFDRLAELANRLTRPRLDAGATDSIVSQRGDAA